MYTKHDLITARQSLKVDENASLVDIKKAYRTQALKHHPDKNRNDSNAKERMQALNNAHELLQKTDNGRKLITESESTFNFADLYAFYEFFDRNWTSSPDDKISESEFQNILNNIEDKIIEHDGLVYPGYEALKGVSAAQIKRLVEHCEDFNGTRFRLSGQQFRPEVLVALLTCLTHFKLESNERCELDLSEIDIKHPEVILALSTFVEESKSEWKLILNKTHLAMDVELAKSLSFSKKIYGLSLEHNNLNDYQVLSILNQNNIIEAIELKKNYLSTIGLVKLALETVNHANLNKVSLSLQNFGADKDAGTVLNAFLDNKGGLKHITLHSLSNSTLFIEQKSLVINSHIESLTLEEIDIDCPTIQSLLSYALPNLKTLHIHKCDLSDEVLKAIAEGLKEARHIESVNIEGTRGLHVGQAAILDAVSNHPTLKDLGFYYYSFSEFTVPLAYQVPTPDVTDALQRLFKQNNVLQKLNLDACNSFPQQATKELEKTFAEHNRTIIKMDLRKVISSGSYISHLVYANYNRWLRIHPESEKTKKEREVRLSREALQHRLNIVEDLINAKNSMLTLLPNPQPKYRNEEPRLSIYKDKYISIAQLHNWLDAVFKGQFTSIDLSDESDLPAMHQGVILERLTKHYQSNMDANPLLSLDLSNNNLMGQVDKLIDLLEVCKQLGELKLAQVKFNPGEITKLVEALAKYPQLKNLALCAEPENTFEESYEDLRKQDVKHLSEYVSRSQTLHSFSLTSGQHDFKSKRMSDIIEGLTNNSYLQKLTLRIYSDGAQDKLIQLIQQSKLEQLTLNFGHCWKYDVAIVSALSSKQLTQFSVSNYPIGRIISEEACFNQEGGSKLTHLTMKSCEVSATTLKSIKTLPLVYLDLSGNRLYADSEGESLIELIASRAETLEYLNLSGHSLHSSRNREAPEGLSSLFLSSFSEALAKCKKLKSLHFSSEREFDVHAIARLIHSIKRYNPGLVIHDMSLPDNFVNDKQHMFNETSMYLKFALQDIQQRQDLKPGLSQQAWQVVSQRYECEIARLFSELKAVLNAKLNHGSRFRFFGGYEHTGPFKWHTLHQTLLDALEKKDYAAFHNQWQLWEMEHASDATDINIGVYLGFIDECLLLYALAIKQCQIKGYDWVDAYPEVPVLANNYSYRLTQLQQDKDEQRRTFEEKWAQDRLERYKKEKIEEGLSEKIMKGEITDTSQLAEALDDANKSETSLTLL